MKTPLVLYEDNHLLVIDKPCGLATMGAQQGIASVAKWAASYIKTKYQKPGNVYVGVVSRLDAAASGVLVLARTSKAASRLSEQIRHRSTTKRYLAVIEGSLSERLPQPVEGYSEIVHFLRKNDALHKVEAVRETDNGAQRAVSRFRVLQQHHNFSIVEVDLVTGRKHQIRVQLSALGNPVLGDKKYSQNGNGRNPMGDSVELALHCYQLTVEHPTRRELMTFQVFPKHWEEGMRKLKFDLQPLKLMCASDSTAPR